MECKKAYQISITVIMFIAFQIDLCQSVELNASMTTGDDDDDDGSFMSLTLEATNDIPDECQEALQMPTKALTGYDVDEDYLCGTEYFIRCRTLLKYIFKLSYTDAARDFMMGLMDALIQYGPKHTCRGAKNDIRDAMTNGGQVCVDKNRIPLKYCSYISTIKFDEDTPFESVCYTLDYSFECSVEAINNNCEAKQLSRLWEKYYRDTIKNSPCSKYSDYGAAASSTVNVCVIFLITILSLVLSN